MFICYNNGMIIRVPPMKPHPAVVLKRMFYKHHKWGHPTNIVMTHDISWNQFEFRFCWGRGAIGEFHFTTKMTGIERGLIEDHFEMFAKPHHTEKKENGTLVWTWAGSNRMLPKELMDLIGDSPAAPILVESFLESLLGHKAPKKVIIT